VDLRPAEFFSGGFSAAQYSADFRLITPGCTMMSLTVKPFGPSIQYQNYIYTVAFLFPFNKWTKLSLNKKIAVSELKATDEVIYC